MMRVVKRSGKPFKSGNKTNTVRGYTTNIHSGKLAYSFLEDDSVVDVEMCEVTTMNEQEKKWVIIWMERIRDICDEIIKDSSDETLVPRYQAQISCAHDISQRLRELMIEAIDE